MVPGGRRHATSDVWTVRRSRSPAGISRLRSGRRSRSFASRATPCRSRSPARAGSVDDLPRVAAQRRHPKRRSGVSRDDSAMARRASRSPPQAGEACAQRGIARPMWRNDWLASSSLRAGLLFPVRPCPGKAVGMDRGKTGGGQTPGARSRSPAACRSTSRTMRPCASAMKPSIKRCSFKVEVRCAAS